ncbi:MAG: flavodoxin family protein [Oscillospiraceae bacterium]|nr:flavodoxin family protein [Oscillospiraceae bacterium]
MRIIMSDIPDLPVGKGDELKAPNEMEKLHHCTGCFTCWIKTPGECIIKDNYADMGALLGRCEELVFVSKCTYGGLSPFVKNVMDRVLPNLLPDFTVRNNEQHHKLRYDNAINLSAYFYGADVTESERATALSLIPAIALNFGAQVIDVSFFKTEDEVKEAFV